MQQHDVKQRLATEKGRGNAGAQAEKIIVAARRGALKFRKQMPPTIAAADRQASVAITQSPLATLTMTP